MLRQSGHFWPQTALQLHRLPEHCPHTTLQADCSTLTPSGEEVIGGVQEVATPKKTAMELPSRGQLQWWSNKTGDCQKDRQDPRRGCLPISIPQAGSTCTQSPALLIHEGNAPAHLLGYRETTAAAAYDTHVSQQSTHIQASDVSLIPGMRHCTPSG